MGDWQFIIVSIAFAVAAVYAGRTFMRQFRQSEDEAGGCASCPGSESTQNTISSPASELSKASRKSD
jgi:hypothetical protein